MERDKQFARNVEAKRIIAGIKTPVRGKASFLPRSGRIIKAAQLAPPRFVRLIGGDSEENQDGLPPTIILEKDDAERICRILVKCGCGRHAELVCRNDDEE